MPTIALCDNETIQSAANAPTSRILNPLQLAHFLHDPGIGDTSSDLPYSSDTGYLDYGSGARDSGYYGEVDDGIKNESSDSYLGRANKRIGRETRPANEKDDEPCQDVIFGDWLYDVSL